MKHSAHLAKLLKDRENQEVQMAIIGTVISPPPGLRISIWNEQVILETDQLYMNDRLFNDHTREYKLTGKLESITIKTTSSNEKDAKGLVNPHGTIEGSGDYTSKGTFINTDTLKEGDLVKITPTENSQIWFVDFKVRKLGGA